MEKNFDYKDINTQRKSGVILHISSLPSKYGIGTLGKEAYEFVDFLKKAGFHYWQILPIGPTGYGDSPYQSVSSFAGNPYFIDFDILIEQKLLNQNELDGIDFGQDEDRVNYGKIYENKFKILKLAYSRFDKGKYSKFIEDNKDWLIDYANFMAQKNNEDTEFHYFLQYIFFEQYFNLKKYVNEKGIKIIGDLPIYCAKDSADVMYNKEQFDLDFVGGCPPDGFNSDGQNWGNPTYNWDYMEKDGFSWWINRIEKTLKLFDITRIDHFRGFESYWAIPAQDTTARNGKWVQAKGYELFEKVKEKLGQIEIIAEDLGYTTKEVVDFRKYTGFPGMKMMQFAYNPDVESDFLPHNIERNWAVYPSTHDSDTVKGWFDTRKGGKEYDFCIKYNNITQSEGYVWGFLRTAWQSVANIAITQMQDFLELGNEARMNEPSTLGNWNWRVEKDKLTDELASRIYEFNKLYSRLNK